MDYHLKENGNIEIQMVY